MTKNKGDADIWGEITEWGKNGESECERRVFRQKEGEMSGWNRQTDRRGEREGGGRLMERGSGGTVGAKERRGRGLHECDGGK